MTDKHITKHVDIPKQTLSDDALDTLLSEVDFLEVPQHFTNKVMQSIDEIADKKATNNGSQHADDQVINAAPKWWQWAALIGGGIPALMQVLAFIFSAWNVSNLG